MSSFLTDQLRLMAEHYPDEVGYINVGVGTELTFREWEEASNRLARGFAAARVAKGDRVSIYLRAEDVLSWLVTYSAVHKAGAVAVPTNTRMAPRELGYVLGHADVVAIVTGGELLATALALRSQLPSLRLVVDATGRAPVPPGAVAWSEVVDEDGSTFQVPLRPEDLADVLYTSGTTGRPKGVAVRHRTSALIPNNVPLWTGAGWLHASPLFTFAGISFTYNPMKLGMTGMFMPRFDAGRWLEVVARDRPAAVFLVPAMAQLLIAHPEFPAADLSSVAMCSLGSASVAPDTLRRLQAKLPNATVSNGYGMTEAGPAYCSTPKEEAVRRIGSVGKPVPPLEVRAIDEAGVLLGPGQVGEIELRLPGRQREYYNDEEATASTWSEDGWLHTGDLGYLDEDGYLYIVGRKKDVIIRGGNNVYATDVEAALYEHPAVQEVAVIGIPHPVLGEDVAAFVVLAAEAELAGGAEALQRFCHERLADYKVPRRIVFCDELPRNATGKVLKDELARLLPA